MKKKATSLFWTLPLVLLVVCGSAWAHDSVLPAGTLLQCTLDEPNFSSATASVGDPVLCHPRAVQMFGRGVFPRGAYIVGHLEADKEPGHFVGKGFLKLGFDRIGLPSTDVPLTAKVIAAGSYKVDRDGKIIGHGHATRDVVEWMIPPLWPWKILSLPARGPRPALKGEVTVTMRLMDDVVVPDASSWQRFGPQSGDYTRPELFTHPRESGATPAYFPAPNPSTAYPSSRYASAGSQPAGWGAPRATLAALRTSVDGAPPAEDQPAWRSSGPSTAGRGPEVQRPGVQRQAAPITLFALKTGAVYAVADYWRDNDRLAYVLSNGAGGDVDMAELDWSTTTQLNAERNVRVTLRSGR